MHRYCGPAGLPSPPIDELLDQVRNFFGEGDDANGRDPQAAPSGAACHEEPGSLPEARRRSGTRKDRTEASKRAGQEEPFSASSASFLAPTPPASTFLASGSSGKLELPESCTSSRTPKAAALIGTRNRDEVSQCAASSSSLEKTSPMFPGARDSSVFSPKLGLAAHLGDSNKHAYCFEDGGDRLDTYKLHVDAKQLEGSAGTFREAHVDFEERQVVVRAVDCSGRTWTLRSGLPGPVIADQCRFEMCKTGKDLSITLKKAKTEEWRKHQIWFMDEEQSQHARDLGRSFI